MLRLLHQRLIPITQARAALANFTISKIGSIARSIALLPKRQKFFLHILGYSAGLHLALLFGLFFVYHTKVQVAHISVRSAHLRNANVVFVPWMKRMPSSKQGAVSASQVAMHQKKGPSLMIADAVKKQTVKQQKKNQPKKTNTIKTKQQKNSTQKEVVKKVPEKKKPPALPKKQEEKKGEQKVPEVKEVVQQEATEVVMPAVAALEPIYIGREEKEMLELEQAIADDIKQVWSVPLGFVWEQPCKVRLKIDLEGKAHDIVFEHASGIMVVDLSITNALEQATFNAGVRGKELTLFFES